MTIFECEDSSDGIFTGVYDAWASHLGHANVRLQLQGIHTLDLFTDYRTVEPDASKAEKVARTIRRRMGEEGWQIIFRAAMARSEEKADCIYRTLVLGLSPSVSEKEAAAVLERLTDPAVCRVFELSRRSWHEAHHYMGFVRFAELKNGVLFSEIEAENQVLPLLADHFADRLPNEDFLIYDRAHRSALLHRRQKPCVLALDLEPECAAGGADAFLSEKERQMQQLWLGFCRSISIEARENPALQQQMLPLRFRKWMTEEQNFTR